TYAHDGDAGLDLYWDGIMKFGRDGEEVGPLNLCQFESKCSRLFSAGIAVSIPDGYEGSIRGRSGMASRGLRIITGTIDAGFTGRIWILADALYNVLLKRGERIAQLVVSPVARCRVVEVDALGESERGESGWGSSGT